MTAKQLVANDQNTAPLARDVYQIIGLINGYQNYGQEVTLTSLDSDSAYSQTIRNLGTGGHLEAQRSTDGATVLAVTDTGLTVPLAATIGNLTVTGTTTLGVLGAGATTVNSLSVTTDAGVVGNLTVQGNTALGNANADTVTIIAATVIKNVGSTAVQLYADPANNRVIVGSATALSPDVTPNLQVIGRLYVAPETANDTALQIRRSSAATVGWTVGVENSPVNLAFKDDSDTKVFALGDAAAPFQALVTGALSVSTSITATGGISAGASSAFTGGLTVVSGGLTVLGGGAAVTGSVSATAGMSAGASSAFTGGVSVVTSDLTVNAGQVAAQKFTANGTGVVFVANGTSQTQGTVGAAGGSSALPANPVGYLKITQGVTTYVIPYYNA